MDRQRCGLGALLPLLLLLAVVGADTPDALPDPLSGLYVRQEATLRKLDGLIAKVSKVDDLETKLDHVTSLLQRMEERNSILEAKLTNAEAKNEAGVVAFQERLETKLVGTEARMEANMKEVVAALGGHSAQVEVRVDTLEAKLKNGSVGVDVGVCDGVASLSEATRALLEAQYLNLSLAGEAAVVEVRGHLTAVLREVVNGSEWCRGPGEDMAGHLEKVLAPTANATQHLVAAVINRIRVSNLAMDKRLGALLHTSSLRQRVLRDTLLFAVASLHSQVRTQAQDMYRKVEARVGGLEASLAAAVKIHTKGLAGQVLEAANQTLASLASRLTLTLQDLHNTSATLLLTLHNLTLQHQAALDLCLLHHPKPDTQDTHIQDTPTQDTPAQDTPTQDTPAQDTHTQDTPTQNTLTQDTQTQDIQTQDTPAQQNFTSNGTAALYQYTGATTSATIITTPTTTITTSATTITTPATITHPQTLHKVVGTLQGVMEARLGDVKDQLVGLRIYLSTSLHMHAAQMEDQLSTMEGGMRKSFRQTVDKLRRSSLSYLDVAVTSVSSAAVASAQATTDQLKEALRDTTAALNARLDKVEETVRVAAGVCPAPYQPVGGTCVAVLPAPPVPWEEARERCRWAGGDLAASPLPPLPLLTLALQATLPIYWIGGQWTEGEWRWVTGEEVAGEVGEEEGECLTMRVGAGQRPIPTPCHNLLPALCQYPPPSTPLPRPPSTPQLPNLRLNAHSNEVDQRVHYLASNEYHYLPKDEPNEVLHQHHH